MEIESAPPASNGPDDKMLKAAAASMAPPGEVVHIGVSDETIAGMIRVEGARAQALAGQFLEMSQVFATMALRQGRAVKLPNGQEGFQFDDKDGHAVRKAGALLDLASRVLAMAATASSIASHDLKPKA